MGFIVLLWLWEDNMISISISRTRTEIHLPDLPTTRVKPWSLLYCCYPQ